jgi:hypothetical protein
VIKGAASTRPGNRPANSNPIPMAKAMDVEPQLILPLVFFISFKVDLETLHRKQKRDRR